MFVDSVVTWISNNESLLSGIAALIAVIGVVLSPFIVAMNRIRKTRGNMIETVKNEAGSTASQQRAMTFRDLIAPSPYPVEFAESDGLKIAYTVRGTAEPTVVLAPGILSHLHVNANLPGISRTYELLAAHNRLVNFDKRGQGLSDPSTRAPSLEERCSDIAAVMDAARVDAGILLGISEAGPMCVKFAHDHPERVKGLILVGTAASFLERDDYPIGIPENMLDTLCQAWGKGVLRDVFLPSLSREQVSDDTYRAMEKLLATRASICSIVDVMKQIDVRELLPAISVPTLVIHFSGDLSIPVRMGRALAEGIPGAHYLEVASVDHADLSQEPEAIDAIRDFCAERS